MLSDMKKAFNAIVHPSSNTMEMSVGNVLKFYYSAAIIPFIIAVILGGILAYAASSLVSGLFSLPPILPSRFASGLAGFTGGMLVLLVILFFALGLFILIPINAIVEAAILQFFSKNVFKFWQGGYNKTFLATLFSEFPIMIFIWLYFIPFVSVILAIWGIIVYIITLAKQQKISGAKAFGAMLVTWIIVGVIAAVIIFAAPL
ncbi:MAG: hypothetical protein QXU98_11205, partial [Candidatus Parvarchaeota archaeon]